MKFLTILGTRPQYIKFKPLYDYFKENKINSVVADTDQHYDYNSSGIFLKQLELEIDYHLAINNDNQFTFLSDAMWKLADFIGDQNPDVVLVMGDTNSSLAAALVANKMGIKVAHIEAGIRCGDKSRPEEINRILVDEMSSIHFVSRPKDRTNVTSPWYVGDLEYVLLNNLENEGKIKDVSYGDFLLMTIHRQENTNEDRLRNILDVCECFDGKIIFPIHHRTLRVIKEKRIEIPSNIECIDPLGYFEMIDMMASCCGIITDSGGVSKTAPFFGKKCLIPSKNAEWQEVIECGYGKQCLDLSWFDDYRMPRRRDFYYIPDACERICDRILSEVGA